MQISVSRKGGGRAEGICILRNVGIFGDDEFNLLRPRIGERLPATLQLNVAAFFEAKSINLHTHYKLSNK